MTAQHTLRPVGLAERQASYLREILTLARNTIEQGWTKGRQARDENGCGVSANCVNAAVAWSASGAICVAEVNLAHNITRNLTRGEDEAARQLVYLASTQAFILLAELTGLKSGYAQHRVSKWNDGPATTKADVLAAFDSIIAALSK